ncbi:MAG: ATP-binding protein [Defluviitaleaceae bacterium]|nr:ATP-binding protein [Defluviitaleaceae bacterium]
MNSIGKVNFVSYDKLSFEISDFDKLEFNKNGDFYLAKGILDFVTITNRQNLKFIYKVEKLEDKEKLLAKGENAKFEHTANVVCSPIGIIESNKINFNLKSYPFLQDDVFLTSNEEFKVIFNVHSQNAINLGLIDGKFSADFDINKLLTFHSAVLGNTGSGKSTTIRQIIKEVLKHNTQNLNLHIFDVHKEYTAKDDKINHIDVLKDYNIPLKNLELQDWVNLVKPSDLVQLPILRMALQLANAISENKVCEIWLKCYLALTMYRNVQDSPVTKRTKIVGFLVDTDIDTTKYNSQFGNLSPTDEAKFISALEEKLNSQDFSFLQAQIETSNYQVESFNSLLKSLDYVYNLEEIKGNSNARNYSKTLEIRIKEVQSRYSSLFNCLEDNSPPNTDNKYVTVYDVSELDDDLLLFFSSYLCKKLFNANRSKKLQERNVNVFLFEEAHRYISRNKEHSQFYEIEIFRKIAREGRKFGCFLYLSSQRPSELSSTVLSQCNNYFLHRVKNNIDLEYLSKTIPYIDSNQLKRLSYLPTGVTYAVGELFPIPIEIKITEPTYNEDVTQTPNIKFI